MARIGSEESPFYGAPTDLNSDPLPQWRGSEDAYLRSIAQAAPYHRESQDILEKIGAEKAKAIKEKYAPYTELAKNIVPAYYQGKQMAGTSEETKLRAEQAAREGQRDVTYGDQAAQAKLAQEQAAAAQGQASVEATRAQTERTKQLTPIEAQQAQKNLGMVDLQKQQMTAAIKSQNLQNESAEDQKKISTVAAIINSRKQQQADPTNPVSQAQVEAQTMQDLRSRGIYDDSILAKGQTLAKTDAFSNAFMNQNILNSDPKYQEAQAIHQKVAAATQAFSAIKAELDNVSRDTSLIDSPQFKQGIANIKMQLMAAGQTELAASLDRNFAEAIAHGEPATKAGRAKKALAALSSTLKNQIAGYSQMAMTNPHIDVRRLQSYMQQVNFNENMAGSQPDLFSKSRGTNPMGQPAAFQPPQGTGMGAYQGAPPPIDLRGAPGARPMNQQPARGQ